MNLSGISFTHEPALWVAAIDSLIVAGIAFGAPISPEQKAAIDATLAVLSGLIVRQMVTPLANPVIPSGTSVIVTPPPSARKGTAVVITSPPDAPSPPPTI